MIFFSQRKLFSFVVLFSTILFTVLVCALSIHAAGKAKAGAISVPEEGTLYTQFSFFYEKNRYLTTNYRRGILVPVNTEVKLVTSNQESIVVKLPNGQDLQIINIKEFSGEGIDGILARTFANQPVDLSPYTEAEEKAIMTGEVITGMRKSAVIVALGYPPKHKTPNLQLDQWVYWQNRFRTFVVHFRNDKVIQIQN